ncbi:DivIVA domain-containing protein [Algoriphagus hitonicola]|uniref:Cell division initiation protein n=1 Tax=Algoriphagus hitonicola TaxID=435880 RepID=A0A1I2PF84_9BACT|nr:DivIVA domain-containing protein [Algoriphagus hitonicola]SFG12081.1 cell division initiation protein [Algoriphagus hitonicola]
MKITPAAIRQQSFETAFRGYEKKEVTTFLDEVSQVVEQLHQENLELKSKLQHVEAEAKRLKDVEDSLFRTLKTAEDTGASIIEEANEAADQIISEANETATNATAHVNQMMEEARKKAEEQASTIISAAELKAKETIVELRESMTGLVRSYEGLVEQREALVKSLKRISQDTINQIDLSEAHFSRIDAKAHQRAIDELSRSQVFTFVNIANLTSATGGRDQEDPEPVREEAPKTADKNREVNEKLEEVELTEEQEVEGIPDLAPKTEKINEEELELSEPVEEIEPEDISPEEVKPPVEVKPSEIKDPEPEQKKDSKNQSGSFFDQFD